MISSSKDRVSENTSLAANESIRHRTEVNVRRTVQGGLAAINQRLRELDREWDIERCLETLAPTFTLLGITAGLRRDRRWFAVPIMVQAFFLQHALQGWCPPLTFLRWLGVRTATEIDEERNALKALRGDYCGFAGKSAVEAEQACEAARR